MKIQFPRATPDQSQILSNLAIESKGYWGHSRAQLDAWRKNLRIEKEYIIKHLVRTILVDGKIVGFFAIKKEKVECVLDHLWLLPIAIGKGIGKQAFLKIEEDCIELEIREISIISDPDAEGFYLNQGASKNSEIYSAPQNRMLPKLNYRIKEAIQIGVGLPITEEPSHTTTHTDP